MALRVSPEARDALLRTARLPLPELLPPTLPACAPLYYSGERGSLLPLDELVLEVLCGVTLLSHAHARSGAVGGAQRCPFPTRLPTPPVPVFRARRTLRTLMPQVFEAC